MLTTSVSLLDRLRRPEQTQAWNRFVELYTPLLLYWARRTGLQTQDAADLVQDIFVLLVQKLPEFTYHQDKNFRGWLRTVLMNCWRNSLRRKSLEAGLANSAELSSLEGKNGLEALWEEEHRQHLVKRALELMRVDFEPTTWQACWGLVVEGRSGADLANELVPQLSNCHAWGILFCQSLAFAQFDFPMRSDEARSTPLLHRLSRVRPGERVSHRLVVVFHELP